MDTIPMKNEKQKPWSKFWRHKQRANNLFLESVENGNIENVKKLINPVYSVDDTAEVRFCNPSGLGAVHIAIRCEKITILKKLLEVDRTLLMMKTEDGNKEYPLHLAVKQQNLGVIKLLLNEFDAPVIVKDINHNTPMHLAIELRNTNIIKLLHNAAIS